jgi:parallel beta-helix repeat protein
LISGNDIDGVQITAGATKNQLSGNFIGTDATGNAALGNTHDGVVVFQAKGNSLIGSTSQTDAFVYYNVIGGNGGNGLWINNANNTTVQGNFFGLGADNNSAVGNGMNGVVVAGTSAHTTFGGATSLGNVVSANTQSGVVVQDKASSFLAYNTFAGIAAFTYNTSLGNGEDGFLITSTGSNNVLRNNVASRNHLNGIHVTDNAKNVAIVGNIAGLDWTGTVNMGNARNGVLIDGNASLVTVGGLQPTSDVIPNNTFSGNGWFGVYVDGSAHNIAINHSFLGTDVFGTTAIGNAYGIVLNGTSNHVNIGSTDSRLHTVISGNNASGVFIMNGGSNTIVGTNIGTDVTGLTAMGNGAAGVYISNSSNNTIGGKKAGMSNTIAHNNSQGVLLQGGTGNAIVQNSIFGNGDVGILLISGANNNQAAPVITSVRVTSQGTQIGGTLTSTPNKKFTVELFASSTNDASGQQYLGTVTVKTDKNGVGVFTFFGPVPSIVGTTYFTATATSASNDTSEFSASATV